MKYIKTFESHRTDKMNSQNLNEEFIGKLISAATGALKNFLGNITAPFKALKDDFKKGMKVEELKKKMSTTVETILKSATDNINKAEDENAINQIKDAFRKEIDEKVNEFDKEIKAIKESVSVDGQLIKEGVKETMIGARVAIGMLKDIAGKAKAEFDVKFAAAKDLAAKKAVAVAEVKKIADDFKKLINDEKAFKAAQDKYMTDNKIEGGGSGTKIVLDWGDVEVELSTVSGEDEKKHPGFLQVTKSGSKKLIVKEGEKVLVKISGTVKKGEKAKMTDILRNEQPDPLKEYETGSLEKITVDDKEVQEYKFGEAKAEDQEDLSKKLGELKTKKPEDIKKVSSYVNFISDEKNKDKIAEIEKIIGGGE